MAVPGRGGRRDDGRHPMAYSLGATDSNKKIRKRSDFINGIEKEELHSVLTALPLAREEDILSCNTVKFHPRRKTPSLKYRVGRAES